MCWASYSVSHILRIVVVKWWWVFNLNIRFEIPWIQIFTMEIQFNWCVGLSPPKFWFFILPDFQIGSQIGNGQCLNWYFETPYLWTQWTILTKIVWNGRLLVRNLRCHFPAPWLNTLSCLGREWRNQYEQCSSILYCGGLAARARVEGPDLNWSIEPAVG